MTSLFVKKTMDGAVIQPVCWWRLTRLLRRVEALEHGHARNDWNSEACVLVALDLVTPALFVTKTMTAP